MRRLQRAAVLLSLIEKMRKQGSWCGETHVQKASFFLQELLEVPLEFDFVLYKHGPYSFDLTKELTSLRADAIVQIEVRDSQYGPSYLPGKLESYIHQRFPKTIKRYDDETTCVADRLGDKGVKELERLATALYVSNKRPKDSVTKRSDLLTELKPHVSFSEAQASVEVIDKWMQEFK